MDLLFKRYADPFLYVNQIIKVNRLSEFVSDFIERNYEETERNKLWDIYIHKVFDKSFFEFEMEVKNQKEIRKPIDFEATANESFSIIEGFVPEG